MQKWLAVVIAAAGLLVAGCQFKADPDIEAVSLRAFDLVRRDDRAQLDALLAPDLKTPVAKQQFTQVIAMLPKTAPSASKFVGQQKFMSATGETTATTTYEHAYPDRVVRAQTSLFRSSDRAPWIVRGFHVQVATLGELAVNDFSFGGKTARHYVALAILLLSPAVMIGALIKVVRTPGLKRKWLWGILAFAGLFSFQFNWTTGGLGIQWGTIQLIGFGMLKGISRFDPWILKATLPIGALLIFLGVWANPARAKKKPSPVSADTAPSPGP